MIKLIVGHVDDLTVLLNLMPDRLRSYLKESDNLAQLVEIVLDLGYSPEVRFSTNSHRLLELGEMTSHDIQEIVTRIGEFNLDNRAGIERTLHRISAIRNRSGIIIGLTCRVGRALEGTVDIIQDIVESGQNCLFLGPPGIGKTTLLREVARVLSTESQKRVIVVDTSNEIAGDGDIPHPAIGFARRMQVPSPDKQHAVMIEAVENHTPEVIVVDEIGTEEESRASRTIAERGVQLVATAHGYNLENLIKNPTLNDLIGGFQTVVLGDEEAKFRGTSKSVVERKGLPTFDVIIVIESRDVFRVYNPVMQYVDAFLRNDPLDPEIRKRKEDSSVSIENKPEFKELSESRVSLPEKLTRIYPYAINAEKLDSLIESMDLPVQIAHELSEADMVLTIKAKVGPKSKVKKLAKTHQVPLHIILSADIECLEKFFRSYFKLLESNEDLEQEAIREIDYACRKVMKDARYYELNPRPGYLRSIQHKIARENGLNSMSVGEDPNRRLRVYPRI